MSRTRVILTYLKPYWGKASLSVMLNFIGVVFSLFSFTMIIPFLSILFNNQSIVMEPAPFEFSAEAVQHNFNYFISTIIMDKGQAAALLLVSVLVVVLVFLKTAFIYFSLFFMASVRNKIVKDIRNNLYDKVLSLPLEYFSEERKGDVISKMISDVQQVEMYIIRSLDKLINDPIKIIVYIYTLFFMSTHLSIFVLILLPVAGFIIGIIGKSLKSKSLQGQHLIGMLLSFIEETLYGLRVIKAFNAEDKTKKRFKQSNNKYTRTMINIWRKQGLASPLSEFMGTVTIVIVMWYGGSLVLNNTSPLSSEAFMGYLVIFSQVINPAKSVSSIYYNIQKGFASLDRINSIMDSKNNIKEKPDARSIKSFNSVIAYKNVFFKYTDEYVLKDINIAIEKGKTIALVGQSGSGKSTLVDLLPRFYDVTEGDITIDGFSIKDYKTKDIRNLIGNVNQDPILFNDSFFNNIAFGVDDCKEEDVIDAAKVANAHDFIINTPGGYHASIGDRGIKLSGGQRQRISIARAVLRNPPIMILDEATSSLDSESEKLVQDALNNLMKNRTSLIIAHRLSTVKHADIIYVIHKGEIVEQGKHTTLLKKNGVYKNLHDNQLIA
jgi:ATP-binding cassette, subfamily B, bacterial MsbA